VIIKQQQFVFWRGVSRARRHRACPRGSTASALLIVEHISARAEGVNPPGRTRWWVFQQTSMRKPTCKESPLDFSSRIGPGLRETPQNRNWKIRQKRGRWPQSPSPFQLCGNQHCWADRVARLPLAGHHNSHDATCRYGLDIRPNRLATRSRWLP